MDAGFLITPLIHMRLFFKKGKETHKEPYIIIVHFVCILKQPLI